VAAAQTTTAYKYDALGRLITTSQPNAHATVVTSISHHPAGSRKIYSTSGATGTPSVGETGSGASTPTGANGPGLSTRKFVVVPLNGFTAILIG
jgi:YD repeat-containing protein